MSKKINGGVARARALSPSKRSEIASIAAAARWGNHNEEMLDKVEKEIMRAYFDGKIKVREYEMRMGKIRKARQDLTGKGKSHER